MFLRIGEVNWFRQPANQANDTFIKRKRNGATAWFFESPGRHQVITTSVVIGQINRTDLCIHRKTDVGNQNIQRLIKTRSTGHLFDYFAQAGEHNLRSLTSFTSVRRCALRLWGTLLKRHHNTCEFFHHPAIDIAFK
ncbi:hypothetical protein D3C81_1404480 [compost metagenome]